MDLIELQINRISYSQNQSGAYAMILDEIGGKRKLPIVIGEFEAQSIAVALDKEIKPYRPFTHDLFKNFASHFEIFLKKVIITKLVDGVFYSTLICVKDNVEQSIDSRTSDAISLALRFKAPIYTYENILDTAGVLLDKSKTPVSSIKEEIFEIKISKLSIKELETEINKAIKSENYERAAQLRDEISKRKNKK